MTRTMRPTSTKRENLCGEGCDAFVFSRVVWRPLSVAGGLSLERPAPAGPLSVAGGLRALLAGSQHC